MDLSQRYYVLAFEALSCPYTFLVSCFEPKLSKVLDKSNEDILWIVLLESDMRINHFGVRRCYTV